MSRKAPKLPPPLLAGGSLIQLEKGLELLRELAAELQDDGPRQLWDNVKSCQRDLENLDASLQERLGAFDKTLQERCEASADAADDLNGEIQTLNGKLTGAVTTMRDSIATSSDALAVQARASSQDLATIREQLETMCAGVEDVRGAVTALEADTTGADNHEDVCARLQTLKETTEDQLSQHIARIREALLQRIASIPPPPSLEGCRNADLEGPLKEYADTRTASARADLQQEVEATASSLRTELGDGLKALREEVAEGLGPLKVLLGDLLERVESREGCCPCMKGELPAPMDALKLEL